MAVLFVAIGFIVTEKNAKYLLSGYNTMSEKERKKIDLRLYIPFFKKFHIFLGVSFFLFGYAINLINKNAAGVFLGVYPILAYLYFVIMSSKFSGGMKTKSNKIGIYVLVGALIFVVGLMVYGFNENKIIFDSQKIEFKGSYGEIILLDQIKSIGLDSELPKITLKTNGFALGNIKKGYFKTKSGEIVKLIINSENKPYILFTKSNGQKIYYSAKEESNEKIVSEIKKTLSNTVQN